MTTLSPDVPTTSEPRTRALVPLGAGPGWGPALSRASAREAHAGRSTPLEDALAACVAACGEAPLAPQRLAAVVARMGFGGSPPVTLAAAGRLAGLTGERVRQLEARVRRHYAGGPLEAIPQLDTALAAVARAAPLPVSAVGGMLADAGVTAGPFCLESLVRASTLFRRDLPFAVTGKGDNAVVLPRVARAAAPHVPLIESRARRQGERCGAFTIASLEEELLGEGIPVPRRQLKLLIDTSASLVACGRRWFTFSDARPAGSFVRASRRMLAVTAPLSLESLHDGLARHNSFRRLGPPPPPAVLADVYRSHPSFVLADGMVSPADPLDPSDMGPLNERIVGVLRTAPAGVMARSELLDACHRAGLNLTSVNLYTTYSECLERIAPGLFAPRGAVTRPLPGVDRTVPGRPERRAADGPRSGWTPAGLPWLVCRVTASTWANGVVHVPAALRRLLGDRRFAGQGADGAPVTTLGIDQHGNSWGWTGFLRRAGVAPGELVRATFDPAAGIAVLEVVGPGEVCPGA